MLSGSFLLLQAWSPAASQSLRGPAAASMADQAVFADFERKWGARLPMLPAGISLREIGKSFQSAARCTWLSSRVGTDGQLSFGCLACEAAAEEGKEYAQVARSYSQFQCPMSALCTSNVLKHHAQPFHKKSALWFLGENHTMHDVGDPAYVSAASPALVGFLQLWDELNKGTAVRAGLSGVGFGHKLAKMRFCIAETMREADREFLATAVCMAIVRDERDSRLSLRFRATTAGLETRSGVLGQAKVLGGGTAWAISQATLRVIKELCTPGFGAPGGPAISEERDAQLTSHIRHIIEALGVDAAENETKSGEDMRRGGFEAQLPNLKLLIRDKCHGSRRPQSATDRTHSEHDTEERYNHVLRLQRTRSTTQGRLSTTNQTSRAQDRKKTTHTQKSPNIEQNNAEQQAAFSAVEGRPVPERHPGELRVAVWQHCQPGREFAGVLKRVRQVLRFVRARLRHQSPEPEPGEASVR